MSSVTVTRYAQNTQSGARLDTDMKHMLERLAALGGKPVEFCRPVEARQQPHIALALDHLLGRLDGAPDDLDIDMDRTHIPGPAGELACRIYRPRLMGAGQRCPLILYLPGGSFVLGDIAREDWVPRSLARKTQSVVVSLQVRQAPEYKFPAAHDDALSAWNYLIAHAAALGADAAAAAIVGVEAGANLALNIGLHAANHGGVLPLHLGLITPFADYRLEQKIERAIEELPFNTQRLRWALRYALRNKQAGNDPRLRLIDRDDLDGLPPVTLILAELDPLREQGLLLADALRRHGVWVDATLYEGVAHEFFGLGTVVNKAMFAQSQLIGNLNASFEARRHAA